MRKRDTAAVFDWLIAALSYQGISDQIAYDYMEQHGYVQWMISKTCPRRHLPQAQELLAFQSLRLHQAASDLHRARSHRRCPLPTHDLRNGRLNQTAYSLYLFIRDIADGDLIGWIDQRLQAANSPAGPDRLARMRDAVIAPLREIYGVSDKVLTMALSSILLGAPKQAAAVARGRGQHDRHRHPRSQLSAPHRHSAPVRRRPCLWLGLLPARRLR